MWSGKKSVAFTREDTSKHIDDMKLDPTLDGDCALSDIEQKQVKVKTTFQLYRERSAEYDLDTTHEITGASNPCSFEKNATRQLVFIISTVYALHF